MIQSLCVILVCQLVGEVFVRALVLPVPGPVAGMILLFLLLFLRDRWRPELPQGLTLDEVETTGKGLLSHLSLMFIPAGVGVVRSLDMLAAHGVALLSALVVSTVLTLLVAVGTFRLVARLMGEEP